MAASWPSTEATIIHSDIVESHDDDGSSYKPEIHFTYAVNGQQQTSEKWSFTVWSSSHKWASSVTERYLVGTKHVCFFNPNKPTDAVLERHFQWINLLGLFTLIFVAVGGGILWFAIRSGVAAKTSLANDPAGTAALLAPAGTKNSLGALSTLDNVDAPWKDFEGPQRLKPAVSRMAVFVGTVLIAAFWNGLSWFMFIMVIKDQGWLSFPGIFLTVFVVIGAGLIAAAFYVFLALFNPVVSIALGNGAVAVGETVDVAWETEGKASRIAELIVELVGQEKATYTRGTSTYTDKKEFVRVPIVKTGDQETIRFGSLTFQIPADTMHTFLASKNKIEWSIDVRGVIHWWPDVKESLAFFVKPANPGESAA